jgi:hypothetical protein
MPAPFEVPLGAAAARRDAGFAAALLDPDRPAPKGLPARRYAVYRNNVTASLIEALAAAYPAVRALVGAAFFDAAAAVFVRTHPPRDPLMILYGADFPDWLAAFPPAASVPYLADVARLERARLVALHAADAEPLPATALAALPPAALTGARLALHPSLGLVASHFPVVSIWAQAKGRAPSAAVDLSSGEVARVVRPALEVTVAPVSRAAASFLGALRAGIGLGAAAEAAALRDDFDLAGEIAALFAAGLVTAIDTGEAPA